MGLCTPRRLVGVLAVVLLWQALSIVLPSVASLLTPDSLTNVSYAVVHTHDHSVAPLSILYADSLPSVCLDAFLTTGTPCASSGSRDVLFDVVWTYVNGSDPLHRATYESRVLELYAGSRRTARSKETPKFFRDHDELRHSMRSVLSHFRAHLSRLHVLLADFPVPGNVNTTEECGALSTRLGQIPQWIDIESRSRLDRSVAFNLHHHAEFFTRYGGTVFNSFSIESQMSNIPGLGEHFLYMNDDYFLTANLTPADFYTQEYGTMLLLQSDAVVIPESWSKTRARGEWFALEYSNEILSRRFGHRPRPYLAHQTKSGSRAIMQEMRSVFSDELRTAGGAVFRAEPQTGSEETGRDVHTFWLFANFIVERAREAMLWSWVVARLGSDDDMWNDAARREVQSLGWMDEEAGDIVVTPRLRTTLTTDQLGLHLGAIASLKRTTYVFASMDGYPVSVLKDKTGVPHWPNLTSKDSAESSRLSCRINLDRCFPQRLMRASDILKHIAFKEMSCGDCVITALVSNSGELGMSAFLPNPDRLVPAAVKQSNADPPHMPLSPDWRKADYTLRNVLSESHWHGPGTVREWTERLLSRYQWVIGSVPSHFQSISSPKQARSTLAKLKADIRAGNVVMLCINDNIALRPAQTSEVFRKWQESVWGDRMVWEMPSTDSNLIARV